MNWASTDLVQGELSNSALANVTTFKIVGTLQALKPTSAVVGRTEATPGKVCALKSGTMVLTRDGEPDLRLQPGGNCDLRYCDPIRATFLWAVGLNGYDSVTRRIILAEPNAEQCIPAILPKSRCRVSADSIDRVVNFQQRCEQGIL